MCRKIGWDNYKIILWVSEQNIENLNYFWEKLTLINRVFARNIGDKNAIKEQLILAFYTVKFGNWARKSYFLWKKPIFLTKWPNFYLFVLWNQSFLSKNKKRTGTFQPISLRIIAWQTCSKAPSRGPLTGTLWLSNAQIS